MTAIDVRPVADAEAVAAAVAAALRTIDANLATFGKRYPGDTTVRGRYPLREANEGWTTSFWPGMLWLAHALTDDRRYHDAALGHVGSFSDRIRSRHDVEQGHLADRVARPDAVDHVLVAIGPALDHLRVAMLQDQQFLRHVRPYPGRSTHHSVVATKISSTRAEARRRRGPAIRRCTRASAPCPPA